MSSSGTGDLALTSGRLNPKRQNLNSLGIAIFSRVLQQCISCHRDYTASQTNLTNFQWRVSEALWYQAPRIPVSDIYKPRSSYVSLRSSSFSLHISLTSASASERRQLTLYLQSSLNKTSRLPRLSLEPRIDPSDRGSRSALTTSRTGQRANCLLVLSFKPILRPHGRQPSADTDTNSELSGIGLPQNGCQIHNGMEEICALYWVPSCSHDLHRRRHHPSL